MVDFGALEKAFRKRDEAVVDELDDEHWTALFEFGGEDEDEDEEDGAYDEEELAAMRAQAAALLGGRPVEEEPVWEDAFYGLCVHFGDVLHNELFDRVNVDYIVELDRAIAELTELEPGFLQKLVFQSRVPLALPPPSDGIILGFVPAEAVEELDEVLQAHHLDLGDRETTAAAVQLREWLHAAAMFEQSLVLYYF